MGEIFIIKNFIPDVTNGCSTIIPVAVSEGSFLAFFPELSSISFSSLGLFEEVEAKYGLDSRVELYSVVLELNFESLGFLLS